MHREKHAQEDLIFTLERTIRNVKESFNRIFTKNQFGLSYDQWLVLEQVRLKQGVSQTSIAKATIKEPAYISRIIDKLQRHELVIKVNDESNKRANKIYLTHKGYDLTEKVLKVYNQFIDKHFKGVVDREMYLVCEILERVNSNYLQRNA